MMDKQKSGIDKSFPIQWTYKKVRFGFSPYAFIHYRLKCYLTHVPLTRKLLFTPSLHNLDCYAVIIVPLDRWSDDPNDIEHALRSDGIWNETNGKEERL